GVQVRKARVRTGGEGFSVREGEQQKTEEYEHSKAECTACCVISLRVELPVQLNGWKPASVAARR
ncbi:hypothetical protein AMECASPLE_029109, partial [Ameca splendens]